MPFDANDEQHELLFKKLKAAAQLAMESARREGIHRKRANKVGNEMEKFLSEAMKQNSLDARRPMTQSGRKLQAGYPVFEIICSPKCYVELKNHSPETLNSTHRRFYYSPSKDPKITGDALRLMIAFQMVRPSEPDETVWRPERFRGISLEDVKVRFKLEYNQSNRELYKEKHVLADETAD